MGARQSRVHSTSTEAYIATHDYPEVIVLSITMHGELSGEDTAFPVPDGLSLFKINASPPCCCSTLDGNAVEGMNAVIEKSLPSENVLTDFSEDDFLRCARNIQAMLRERQDELLLLGELREEKRMSSQRGKKRIKMDTEEEEFLDMGTYFHLQECTGKIIMDKTFDRNVSEKADNAPEDMTITVINLPGHPDLVEEMYARGKERPHNKNKEEVTTKELLEFLVARQIKAAIIIDFSCNAFFERLSKPQKSKKRSKITDEGLVYGGHGRETRK